MKTVLMKVCQVLPAEKDLSKEETATEETDTSEEEKSEETPAEEKQAEDEPTEEEPAEDTPAEEAAPEPKPATFRVSNLEATLTDNTSDISYLVKVAIQNTGDLRGTYSLVSKVDGERMDSIKVELSPNQKKTITLTEAQKQLSSMAERYKNQEIQDQTCKVSVGSRSKTITFPEIEYMLQLLSSWGTNYGGFELAVSGQVKNISGTSLKDVEAVVDLSNSQGEFLYSESKLIYRNPLEPGQTSSFDAVGVVEDHAIKYYKIFFRFKSGKRIPTDYSKWNK